MFGLRLFRFRSPERNRETDEQRLACIREVVRAAVSEAEAEFRGFRARVARTWRSMDVAPRAEKRNSSRTE
jgi:hypothetical protein